MTYKTTNKKGQSHGSPWTKSVSSSPATLGRLRYSLLAMLFMLCGGGMWAQETVTKWVETAPADLVTGDVVVIADKATAKAMPNEVTSSAPQSTKVDIASNEITGEVPSTLQWTVTVGTTKIEDADTRTYQFSTGTNYLYNTDTNNGVRVGVNDNKTFIIKVDPANNHANYLYNTANSRYIGNNGGTDWRCYTSINNNIKETITAFYKKSEIDASTYVANPVIQPAGGFYSGTQTVSITNSTANATIYYTTDGTEPSASNGTVYTEAFEIAKTTTIKAIAVNGENSSSTTEVRLIIHTNSLPWYEDWEGYAKDELPSDHDTNYSQDSSSTKIYTESSAGGATPELLITKSTGKFTIKELDLSSLNGKAATLTLSYLSNRGDLKVTSTVQDVTIGNAVKDENNSKLYTHTITIPAETEKLDLTIASTTNNNARIDNLSLVVTDIDNTEPGEDEPEGNALYSWESPEGTAVETGGTAATYNGTAVVEENDDVNVVNSTYYVLRLQGKNDFTTKNIVITLDKALHGGDIINMTAYRNKNDADKKAGALIKFDKGSATVRTDTSDKQGLEFVNIDTSDKSSADQNRGTEPNTVQLTVPEEAAGSKTLTLTRAQTGTNLFITKLVITTTAEDDPNAVETPVITPATGTFAEAQQVTITCNTEDAVIYYTTDGNEPTANSTAYDEPFTVSETTTVKAIAIKGDYSSDVAESVITISSVTPGTSNLEWDYTEKEIPSNSPDNGLYYTGSVNDAAGTNNGMHGVKLNNNGYAWFAKNPVAGKLTLTFGNRKTSDAYEVNVYACTIDGEIPTKGDLIGAVSASESPGIGSIDIAADVTGIWIERKTGSEGVLSKIVFKEDVARTFVDFEMVLGGLSDEYDTSTLPAGVSFTGTYNSDTHGYRNATIVVPVDGTVKFTIGGCQYANKTFTVTNQAGETLATLDPYTATCYHQDGSAITYIYTGEADVLTFNSIQYLPYFKAEATEVQEVTVTFKDQNGNELGKKTVIEGEAIGEIPYTEADLTIPEGEKFRGWVYASGIKVKDTDIVDGNKTITASVTAIETSPEVGSIQTYDLTKATFYPEDHENFSVKDGTYYNNHGFDFAANGSFTVAVTGKAQVVLTLCQHGNGTTILVSADSGATVAADVPAKADTDGATTTVNYEGPDGSLTFTFASQTYLHSVMVYNVSDFVEKDDQSDYYIINAGDAAGLIMAINAAASEPDSKIFLPNGTYDLGETVLTAIGGKNVSIIGQSMEGVIIKTTPDIKSEGLGTADLLVNTGEGLYLQDLTLQNALDYYNAGSSGRAATLHDMGTKTINKNVRHLSYQDTYYSHKTGGLYYFEGGEIHGTVDYMCGNGKAYFNGVTLVNERRSSATMTANSELYVFNECTVKNNADTYNFGRAWNDNPTCVWLNTTLEDPDRLTGTRWNLSGINCDYGIAGEYGTKNAEGNNITPDANTVTFTKASTTMNTILTAEQAAGYTIDKVLGEWAATAQSQVAQTEAPAAELKDGVITWQKSEGATAYALFENDELLAIVDSETTSYTVETGDNGEGAPALHRAEDNSTPYSIRAANGRGGFGEPMVISKTTGINGINGNGNGNGNLNGNENGNVKIYDLQGRQVKTTTGGVYIVNGKKVLVK